MHTKTKKALSVGTISIAIVVIGFFGYVSYRHFIHDAAAAIANRLAPHIDNLPEDQTAFTSEQIGIRRAQIALEEYGKNVYEQPAGSNSGPEIDKYTGGNPTQWCTLFATWVTEQAGSPVWHERTQSTGIVNSRDFANYLMENGTWYDREQVINEQLEPRPGDFIVYWRGNFESNLGHVDVVADTSGPRGTADLVGGNLNERVQLRENFPYLQNYGFLGFGRPEKS